MNIKKFIHFFKLYFPFVNGLASAAITYTSIDVFHEPSITTKFLTTYSWAQLLNSFYLVSTVYSRDFIENKFLVPIKTKLIISLCLAVVFIVKGDWLYILIVLLIGELLYVRDISRIAGKLRANNILALLVLTLILASLFYHQANWKSYIFYVSLFLLFTPLFVYETDFEYHYERPESIGSNVAFAVTEIPTLFCTYLVNVYPANVLIPTDFVYYRKMSLAFASSAPFGAYFLNRFHLSREKLLVKEILSVFVFSCSLALIAFITNQVAILILAGILMAITQSAFYAKSRIQLNPRSHGLLSSSFITVFLVSLFFLDANPINIFKSVIAGFTCYTLSVGILLWRDVRNLY